MPHPVVPARPRGRKRARPGRKEYWRLDSACTIERGRLPAVERPAGAMGRSVPARASRVGGELHWTVQAPHPQDEIVSDRALFELDDRTHIVPALQPSPPFERPSALRPFGGILIRARSPSAVRSTTATRPSSRPARPARAADGTSPVHESPRGRSSRRGSGRDGASVLPRAYAVREGAVREGAVRARGDGTGRTGRTCHGRDPRTVRA